MKIIIVNGKFLTQRVTGVQRYARELLKALDQRIERNQIFLAIPFDVKDIPFYKNIKVVSVGKRSGIFWEQVEFPLYVKCQHGMSLNLCNVAPLIAPGIVCIHDMKVKAHPEFFGKIFRLWYDLLFYNETKRATKIITVSEFSKHEIVKYYKVNANRITVITNAWQHYNCIQFDENALSRYGLQKDRYYFAMGSMDPNKNFKRVAEMAKQEPNSIFAVAGAINKKVFAKEMGFECPTNMHLLGYVTDEEAKTLMRDCKAFLFPSIYEGFGIPPLEAVSAGTKKIVVSDIPVMHEIFEEDANYIDLNEDVKIEKLHKCSGNVLKKYSWIESSEKLYQMITEQ